MSRYVFKLPDLGEGTVDAEVVAWRVKPGDTVAEDDPLVEMMTEKATVEVPSPVSGRVLAVRGEPGEKVPVGSELAVFETQAQERSGAAAAGATPGAAESSAAAPKSASESAAASAAARGAHNDGADSADSASHATGSHRVLTSPAIRRRAHEAGVDLQSIGGSGPSGRILRSDLEAHLAGEGGAIGSQPSAAGQRATKPQRPAPAPAGAEDATEEIRIIGLRRVIAERMSESARSIPHFSYVEEVDVTELERLRGHLNAKRAPGTTPLTYLPFLLLALVRTVAEHRECNAIYDAARGVVVRHRAVHVGIATQTAQGLKVPVVRHAERRSLDDL
ncbi:MAG: dihydrolipoamide acetyltransferase family protein, partial [Steroidobacteraceae bacterium]